MSLVTGKPRMGMEVLTGDKPDLGRNLHHDSLMCGVER